MNSFETKTNLYATSLPLDNKQYDLYISTQWETLSAYWPKLSCLYLSQEYLKTLHHVPNENIKLIYLILAENNKIKAVSYFQLVELKGNQSYQLESEPSSSTNIWRNLMRFFSNSMLKCTKIKILVAGNLMNVGTNFMYFKNDFHTRDKYRILGKMIKRTLIYLGSQNIKVHTSLIKEVHENDQIALEVFKDKYGYYPFQAEPNMVVHINWASKDEYLEQMSSKYRVRVRRAEKKLQGITRILLSLEEIIKAKKTMYELYKNVANEAQLNMVNLNPDYHTEMKKNLGASYQIIAYYFKEQLVGFYSLIFDREKADAGYLGLESEYNQSHQLYLNMLYDMVFVAIEKNIKKVTLARTALEIKSSIGAVPEPMALFIRHQNTIIHKLYQNLLERYNTPAKWKQRHPFKSNR